VTEEVGEPIESNQMNQQSQFTNYQQQSQFTNFQQQSPFNNYEQQSHCSLRIGKSYIKCGANCILKKVDRKLKI
jgi:hypothetical protein